MGCITLDHAYKPQAIGSKNTISLFNNIHNNEIGEENENLN